MPAALVTLFGVIQSHVPNGVTWSISSVGDVIRVEDGELTGTVAIGGGGVVNSSGGSSDYKPGVGIRLLWTTGGIVGGRRVHGTTFVCPTLSAEIPNGALLGTTATALNAGMNAYVGNPAFEAVIYSRPKAVKPPAIGPDRPGATSVIVSGVAMNAMSWLRSRRV